MAMETHRNQNIEPLFRSALRNTVRPGLDYRVLGFDPYPVSAGQLVHGSVSALFPAGFPHIVFEVPI